MQFNFIDLLDTLTRYLWPAFRVGGLLLSMPIVSASFVPAKVRVLLLISLVYIIAPFNQILPSGNLFSLTSVTLIFQEMILGVLMGFVFELVFQSFIIGGQIIAMQSGLGFATLIDPASQASVPLISQLYLMLVSLIFIGLNGHLLVFQVLVESFQLYPVGKLFLSQNMLWELLVFSTWMFKGAILIALPAIVSLLLVNLSFGVMTRAAPQLNIFSIGFPITLTLGVIIIYVTLYGVLPHVQTSMEHAFEMLRVILR